MSHVFLQAIRQPNNFAGCSVYRLKILSRYVLIWIKMDLNVSMRPQHYKLCSKHCFLCQGYSSGLTYPVVKEYKCFTPLKFQISICILTTMTGSGVVHISVWWKIFFSAYLHGTIYYVYGKAVRIHSVCNKHCLCVKDVGGLVTPWISPWGRYSCGLLYMCFLWPVLEGQPLHCAWQSY